MFKLGSAFTKPVLVMVNPLPTTSFALISGKEARIVFTLNLYGLSFEPVPSIETVSESANSNSTFNPFELLEIRLCVGSRTTLAFHGLSVEPLPPTVTVSEFFHAGLTVSLLFSILARLPTSSEVVSGSTCTTLVGASPSQHACGV